MKIYLRTDYDAEEAVFELCGDLSAKILCGEWFTIRCKLPCKENLEIFLERNEVYGEDADLKKLLVMARENNELMKKHLKGGQ
jgi:hypothetical protein